MAMVSGLFLLAGGFSLCFISFSCVLVHQVGNLTALGILTWDIGDQNGQNGYSYVVDNVMLVTL